MRAFISLLLPCAGLAACVLPAGAQAAPACALFGRVTDPSGARVGSATLRLTAQALTVQGDAGVPLELPVSAAGEFRGCALPAGDYLLNVAAPGFLTAAQTLHVPAAAPVEVMLKVARAESNVQVNADEEDRLQVDPATVGSGTTLSQAQAASVPLISRSFTDLLAITPGVVPISSAQPNAVVMSGVASTPPSGDLDIGALSVSGQRETANAFHINGANVQEDVNMGVAIVPSLDSVAELEVLTNAMDARYGNQSGGQIQVTTRSGSDHLHGGVFDYFRNTAFDARNYFSLVRAPYHQNVFGGTLGGPVPRLKTFFFGDYEGTRQTQGIDSGLISVPTLAERAGDLTGRMSALTGSVSSNFLAQTLSAQLGRAVTAGEPYTQVFATPIAPAQFSAPAQHLLAYIPQPNVDAQTFSTSSYAQQVHDDKGALRVDHASRAGQLAGYYFGDHYTLINPYPTGQGGATVPGFNARNEGLAQLASVNLVSSPHGSWVNQAHASYLRNTASAGRPLGGVGAPLAGQGFVTGGNTSGIDVQNPAIEGVENVIFNSFTLGTPVTPLTQAENTVELTDDVEWTRGRHTFALGTGFHVDQVNTHPVVYDNGSFAITGSETGSDFADFLLGVDSNYTQGHGQSFYNRNHYVGLYAQDKFQLSPRVVVSYGLRYDILPPWSEKYNQLLSLDPNEQSVVFPTAPKGILVPGDPGVPKTLAPTRYDNFAPRLSVAWTPVGQSPWVRRLLGDAQNTVVRAGYGVYYAAFEGLSAAIISGNPPYGVTYTTPGPTLLAQPFVATTTGVSIGQRFPLAPVAFGASAQHPNTSVDWANFEPLTGIPAFDKNNVTPYTENYNATLERSFGEHTTFSASYVGTQAHHLLVIQEVNPGNPQLCLALAAAGCGPFGESSAYTAATGQVYTGTRGPFSGAFGSINLQRTIANSHDNALELSLRHADRRLFLQVGYTWSKSIDQSSSLAEAVYPDVVPGGAGASRALSAFDLTHNFVASYKYTLPLAALLGGHARLTDGWQISGLTRFSSGLPVTLVNNNDTSLLGTPPNGINDNGIDEPAFTGASLQLKHRPQASSQGGLAAFDTSQLTLPALGTLGNARRRFFYGPGADNTDVALTKQTPIKEGSLELRAEAFNVFNHSQFFGPAAINGNISASNFGQFQTASPPRLMQLAARLRF